MMIHSILRQASDGGSSHQNEQSYLAGGQALKRWIDATEAGGVNPCSLLGIRTDQKTAEN